MVEITYRQQYLIFFGKKIIAILIIMQIVLVCYHLLDDLGRLHYEIDYFTSDNQTLQPFQCGICNLGVSIMTYCR